MTAAEPDPGHLPDTALGSAPGRGRMTGRRVLVVGAGTEDYGLDDPDLPVGNGRAISALLARVGGGGACADLVVERAAVTLGLVEREGGRGVAIGADASLEADVIRMFDEAAASLGGLDGIVCNVGMGRGGGLAGTTVDAWDAVMAVNLRSHFLGCKHGMPRLDPGGAIVLISSLAGHRPGSGIPAYDSSKAALGGLCRHAAMEGERSRLRVNVVAPGLVDTPLGRLATKMRPGRTKGRLPFGRQATAWDVAYATVFLLSDEACYVTGQVLAVDGGASTVR